MLDKLFKDFRKGISPLYAGAAGAS